MDTNIATKLDILNLRNLAKEDIYNLNNQMRDEFTGVKKDISNLKNEIKSVESKITIKFGLRPFVFMSLIIGVLGALIKL